MPTVCLLLQFDEFYVGTITSVQEAGESFFERVFRQEFAGYQIELLLLLDGARNELIRSFDKKRKTLAKNTISKLQGVVWSLWRVALCTILHVHSTVYTSTYCCSCAVAYKRLSIITEDVQYGLDRYSIYSILCVNCCCPCNWICMKCVHMLTDTYILMHGWFKFFSVFVAPTY